jgi:hypothetical protein
MHCTRFGAILAGTFLSPEHSEHDRLWRVDVVSSPIKLDTGTAAASPGRAPLRAFAHRRSPRCPLTVPVRVTVLRAGTAYSIPGRSVDLGEGGIAVVLAGEVRPADSVGVEFLLPDLGLGLQAKAVVRHNAPLRCGFEFRGLTRHQQAVIREWIRQRMQAKSDQRASANGEELDQEKDVSASPDQLAKRSMPKQLRLAGMVTGVLLLAGLLLFWWRWESEWRKLEKQIPQPASQVTSVSPSQILASLGAPEAMQPGTQRNPIDTPLSVVCHFQIGDFTLKPRDPCERRAE